MTHTNLIRTGIQGLLSDINNSGFMGYDVDDMAEEPSFDEELVYEWLQRNGRLNGEAEDYDAFCEEIETVMESEWYEEQYENAVQEARQYFEEQTQRKRYEQSHMPEFKPKHNFKY